MKVLFKHKNQRQFTNLLWRNSGRQSSGQQAKIIDQALIVKVFGAFFALLNPFVILPFFLAMTDGFSLEMRRRLALRMFFYAACMGLLVMAAGGWIISFFGIRVSVFRIAGGMLLAQIAWSMLHGQKPTSHQGADHEHLDRVQLASTAFYPMPLPLMIGPGVIATTIIFAGQASSLGELFAMGAILLSVLAMVLAVLWFASFIGRALSETMRVVMTRLMGMILLAMALEMITAGLRQVF